MIPEDYAESYLENLALSFSYKWMDNGDVVFVEANEYCVEYFSMCYKVYNNLK
jgi:hypothetical protein